MKTGDPNYDTRIVCSPARRELLAVAGASGVALLVGSVAALAAMSGPNSTTRLCVARPEQTEGPYFVEEGLNRSDIRSDPRSGDVKPGLPLRLTFRVSRMNSTTCIPLVGAQVDVWHCDAVGRYSDMPDSNFSTDGPQFLRGYQLTDEAGSAQFLTIYPGWYEGRTVHVHFKIRAAARSARSYEFTSQLYFDDALTDRIYAAPPYTGRGRRSMRNADDGIFRRGGRQLVVEPEVDVQGYAATFDIGLQV